MDGDLELIRHASAKMLFYFCSMEVSPGHPLITALADNNNIIIILLMTISIATTPPHLWFIGLLLGRSGVVVCYWFRNPPLTTIVGYPSIFQVIETIY